MGFFKAVPFFTGATKEGVDIFNEAEQICWAWNVPESME